MALTVRSFKISLCGALFKCSQREVMSFANELFIALGIHIVLKSLEVHPMLEEQQEALKNYKIQKTFQMLCYVGMYLVHLLF